MFIKIACAKGARRGSHASCRVRRRDLVPGDVPGTSTRGNEMSAEEMMATQGQALSAEIRDLRLSGPGVDPKMEAWLG